MQTPFRSGALVVLYLHSPREKVWGVLKELTAAGVSVRGVDLRSFDDWLRGAGTAEGQGIAASMAFYPLARVEKILLDEPEDGLGFDAQCAARTGRRAAELLDPAPAR
ncbi:MAG TPA: hypothetical protein VJV23_09580 [Candidatus Polarisedimenticolia bacterium]|nr:hypothetical protein [Candidatus Polarisedimenticolia bacterium]